MDKERNLKKIAPYNFKSSDKIAQRNKRKESPYSISDIRIKKSCLSSPEKQGDVKKTSLEVIKVEEDINDDIPDRSFGDFYCKACNAHMISEHIWESHIKGKRHLKNTKRKGSELQCEFVDQDPIILPEIKKVQKPIIGLQHCCEILRSDGKPIYQCFLCSTSIPNSKLLIEHVIGLKHRMSYLKIHDAISYNVIMKADLKKGMIEPLVEEFIQKYQDKHGLGKMRVKIAKPTSSFNNSSKPYKDDLILKKNRNVGRNSYDDVKKESPSENTDWRHIRNSYDDVRNESTSEDPNRKYSRNSYDDIRNESESKPEEPDWKHSRKSYDDVRNDSSPEDPDWKHSRQSYENARNESKTEDSTWRQISGKERDYHSNDNYASKSHYEKPVRQQNHFDKNEMYSERRSLTPPLKSKVNYEVKEVDLYANSNLKMPNQMSEHEDLRDFLEKKRMMQTNTKIAPNNTKAFEFLSSIIEDMPNMTFLELVLHKVQKMKNHSEAELNMLSKIGKYMFSIVMEKKMDMLTPDLRKKYQSVTNDNINQSSIIRTATPEQKSTNKFDFQSLMDLIKNPKREIEKPLINHSFPLQNVSSQHDIPVTGHQPAYTTESPNFIPNLWGTPSPLSTSSVKDFPAIPGLTLSDSREIFSGGQYSYPQVLSREPYAPTNNVWSTIQHKNNLNPY